MGKKKIVKQSGSDALKQADKIQNAVARSKSKGVNKKLEHALVYVAASYNNTSITVTNDKGDVVAWATSGSLGFNGPKKSTPFAASKIVAAIAEKLRKSNLKSIEIIVKGVGTGRDSAIRSLANQGFDIVSIKDVTPVPHNGPKPKKTRRV